MLRFILILAAPADECHSKKSVVPAGISTIKYLDNTSISFLFAASAYALYKVCLLSFHTGVSRMQPWRFKTADKK